MHRDRHHETGSKPPHRHHDEFGARDGAEPHPIGTRRRAPGRGRVQQRTLDQREAEAERQIRELRARY